MFDRQCGGELVNLKMRRSTRLSAKNQKPADAAGTKRKDKSVSTGTGPPKSSVAASVERKGRGATATDRRSATETSKRRGVGKKDVKVFQGENEQNDELFPSVVVEQCEQLGDDALVDNNMCAAEVDMKEEEANKERGNEDISQKAEELTDAQEEATFVKDRQKNVEAKEESKNQQENSLALNDACDSTSASVRENKVGSRSGRGRPREKGVISEDIKDMDEINNAPLSAVAEKQNVSEEKATKEKGQDKNSLERVEESKSPIDEQEMASFQIINESEPLSAVDATGLKLQSGNVLSGQERMKKSGKNRTDPVKQTSQNSIIRNLRTDLDVGKLKTRLNLSSNKSCGKSSLLKLTSDAFANLNHKLSKDDLIPKPVKEQSRVSKKSDPVSIHNLDIIALNTDDGKKLEDNKLVLSSELDAKINSNDLYFELKRNNQGPVKDKVKKEDTIMKKSVLPSDLEKKDLGSQGTETMTQKKKKRKRDQEETAGPGWYNLPKTEVTDDIKKDLQVLKMRHLLNPKRFYKKGETNRSK